MGRWTPPFLFHQQVALSVVSKVSSTLSIFGSVFIIQYVIRKTTLRQDVFHRIMLLMSSMDLVFSIKSFVSVWALPADFFIFPFGKGNITTCTLAAFFGQGSGLSSIIYNGSLSLFFLLTIRYGWKEERIKKSRLEILFHVVPLSIGWGTAIAGLPLTLYNPIGWTCWIGSTPFKCKDSYRYGEEATCVRGDNAWIYKWAFWYAELWLVISFHVVAMIMIYLFVLGRERRNDRYAFLFASHNNVQNSEETIGSDQSGTARQTRNPDETTTETTITTPDIFSFRRSVSRRQRQRRSRSSRVRSKECARRALHYMLVFIVTWIFPLIWFCIERYNGKTYTVLVILSATFVPLQGFFDFLVYARPIFIQYRLKQKQQRERRESERRQHAMSSSVLVNLEPDSCVQASELFSAVVNAEENNFERSELFTAVNTPSRD